MRKMSFFSELWKRFRPRGVKLGENFLVAAGIYLGLYVFAVMKRLFPIPGRSANAIDNLHAAGSVAAFLIFTILSAIDMIHVRRRKIQSIIDFFRLRSRE